MNPSSEPATVEHVDLQRYLGTWYEIARKPIRHEDRDARDLTATYELKDNGKIRVLNRCLNEDGEYEDAEGEATALDASNARLSVSFMPKGLRWVPFTQGDYWVLGLDPGYNVALVGTPDRKYLWLLARDAQLDEASIQHWLGIAQSEGYDISDVIRPQQSGAVPGA
ncbi:lipocalin family protein [Luteimonas sp. e5]